jgi:predicted deacylase
MKEIRIGTAVSTDVGLAKGELRLADMPDGEPITIPVAILRGAEGGPTVWLQGCVHGDEYCGTFIIHELLRSVSAADLTGTVIALPILNITASMTHQRMSPFETMSYGDLNRCFPGKAGGSLTEQMGHAIYTPLKEYADYLIDFHTALTADVRWALYADVEGEVGQKAEGVARAFGYKSTLPAPTDILGGSALMTAAKDGIPSYIVEAGGIGQAFDSDTVADAAERLRNVLRHLGMLAGEVTDYGPLTYFSNFAWINAVRGGLFQPLVKCGDPLDKGTIVGKLFDVFGDLVEEVLSPKAGVVLAINAGPVMASGEVLVHIGLDPRQV